jgi:hypothetical protein
MPELAKETSALLQYLLPGFLAAWVYYSLTSHTKPIQFERVIQALIFTLIIQILLVPFETILTSVGRLVALRPWDAFAAQLSSMLLAVGLGSVLAFGANRDIFYKLLRKLGLTSRSSHPSEWFAIFDEKVTYVVLHMKDERRLYGWPKEWPTEPSRGHFYIMQPSWLYQSEDEKSSQLKIKDMTGVDGILVCVTDVKWVEFLNRV